MATLPHPPLRLTLRLASDPQSVRDGLVHLTSTPPLRDLSLDCRGTTEIVLAEVLNNIVEHAYAGASGPIDITMDYDHPVLSFEVEDCGVAMPAGRIPLGELSQADALADLPEGGFGWFLIRTLTRGLVYQRRTDRNRLAFWLEAS